MSALLMLTAGQTDVQLVERETRRDLTKAKCAILHDEIERRAGEWRLVDSPSAKREPAAKSLPTGNFALCTPKLDALLRYMMKSEVTLNAALILETRRDARAEPGDPRYAGTILAARLRALGVTDVQRAAFLEGREHLEDRNQPRDAFIRSEVVGRLDCAVRAGLSASQPRRIVVAATGGMPVVSSLVEEIVRLHAAPDVPVDLMEVADGAKANPPTADRAVPRHSTPEPAASYQARRHALELIEKGNLLGAWGAVQYLHEDKIERRWTRVIEWLACFAASRPVPADCDIPVLTHCRMAVRAGLRVELALRAGDIPKAVHGTVAFFESALWDHLGPCLTRHNDPEKRLYKVEPTPNDNLVRRGDGCDEDRKRPFKLAEEIDGICWYWVYDEDVCGIRLAKHYLKQEPLLKLGQKVSKIRYLRNDVAHNEPTTSLMEEARRRMAEVSLWSEEDRFLTQPLVQGVLKDLGQQDPSDLFANLVSTVRARLLQPWPP